MLRADKCSINRIRSLFLRWQVPAGYRNKPLMLNAGAMVVESYTVEFQAKDYKEILQALVFLVQRVTPAPMNNGFGLRIMPGR